MADLNISLILRLVDKATGPARAAMRVLERIGGEGLTRQARNLGNASRQIASGLGTISGAAVSAVGKIASFEGAIAGIGLAALARSFINEAATFERYQIQLENLEGSAAKAEVAMRWIEDFAVKTPLEMSQVVDAYMKLKAYGIDPTNGSLMAMVDTMAATGGGAEKLDGLVLALGQAWTKGKLQGEEALQLLERGVPVYDILAKRLGKTTEQIVAMQAAGKLGREEIALLIEELGQANDGAAEDMSETWDGIISNLWDHWARFKRMVMSSGLFDWLKSKMGTLLDTLDRMAADGTLLRWAENMGTSIQGGLQALWDFGGEVVRVWQDIWPAISSAAEAVGGFGNAAKILIALNFAPQLIAIAGGLRAIAAAALANPILLLIGAMIAGGYAVYKYWDDIVEVFERLKARAEAFWEYLNSLTWSDIGEALKDAFMSIDLVAAGVAIIQSLWDGMKLRMDDLVAWAKEKLSAINPFGPAPSSLSSDPNEVAASIRRGQSLGYGQTSTPVTGARALGGPVRAGQIYRWMEEGEEFFSPALDGQVIPNRAVKALRAGVNRQASFRIGGITINAAPGQSPQAIAREVRRQLEAMAREKGFALHDGGAYVD